MLEHLNPTPAAPARVVIMGAAGFVGGAIAKRVARDGVPVLALGRKEVDLCAEGAAAKLASLLRPDDAFVAVSARAPCKNADMFVENAVIAAAMAGALAKSPVAHVLNIGSDAIYADSADPLTETSCASPDSLHGAMHLAREVILKSAGKAPFVSLRPTLVYGAGDPHNGYGPNRFMRLAKAGQNITLFGEGEERRDHVFIDDVAAIVRRCVLHGAIGIVNAVSGTITSFREIAEMAADRFQPRVPVIGTPRVGPMPHNGYRAFDAGLLATVFPDFSVTTLADGLDRSLST